MCGPGVQLCVCAYLEIKVKRGIINIQYHTVLELS